LTKDEIRDLFSGAPQFSVQSLQGRRQAKVAFPHDLDVVVCDVSDCRRFSHEAFSSATLRRHLCAADHPHPQCIGYDIEAIELPGMLSAQGLEPGTIGLEYFLELPQSDSLQDEGEDSTDQALAETARNQELMEIAPEKLGIKPINPNLLYDRLRELGQVYQKYNDSEGKTTILDLQSPSELYALLFGGFLMPPRFDGSTGDPTGLKVQVETLLKILRLKGIWHNFSMVEWRIRLGQLLWNQDVTDQEENEQPETGPSDRDVVLLQILLACELLLRLDAIAGLELEEVTKKVHLTHAEVVNFKNLKTRKTDWDLVLARRFLENVEIVEAPKTATPKKRSLLASLIGTRSEESLVEASHFLRPRHQEKQVSGLLHFAELIGWTNLDAITADLSVKVQLTHSQPPNNSQPSTQPHSLYGTPLDSPLLTPNYKQHANGYFDVPSWRPNISRSSTQRSIQLQPSTNPRWSGSATHSSGIGGWLSRTWLTGMILPGEAISHFLISTLLENDHMAIAALGETANLYGGFVLGERSWWSKSCITGRVLATMEGAQECMGWISVACIPEGHGDGWIDVPTGVMPNWNPKPRLYSAEEVAADSSVTGSGSPADIRGTDFVLPRDNDSYSAGWSVHLSAFTLEESGPANASLLSDGESGRHHTASCSASSPETPLLHFAVLKTAEAADIQPATHILHSQNVTIPLVYDVYFIAAWPCTPVTRIRHLQLMHVHQDDVVRVSVHPLHVSHPFRVVNAAELVADPPHIDTAAKDVLVVDARARDADSASNSSYTATNGNGSGRGGSVNSGRTRGGAKDAELLARAWCAERGLHAVIGRAGRTCIACCVREARALGVRVVIRI
ncbi:hypothetical protein K490DRAFT_52359, partial [Saccharata proteae CBS 121410]